MKFLLALSMLFLLLGCSSKSKFEPKKIASSLHYDSDMKSELSDVASEGATYDDGMVVTKKRGLLKYKIEKGFRFIYDTGSAIMIADNDGDVKVLKGEQLLFEKKFDFALASGAVKNNILALVFSNNTLMLYDMKMKKALYEEVLEPTFANDAKIANPLFLNDLVIFPTLDGRLLIMDSKRKVIVRDIAISDKALFNNIIFLEEKNDILVAATGSKIVSINPKNINTKRVSVKDVIYDNNVIYLFTKTGKVLMMDLNLDVKKEMKFPFAIFSAVMASDKLYAIEKSGYLITIDKNLDTSTVQALPSEIVKPLFAFKNRLFFGQQFLKIK